MHNCYLYLVLKQRTLWCVVIRHMKIRVKSEDIDLHTFGVLKQHICFYSVAGTQLINFFLLVLLLTFIHSFTSYQVYEIILAIILF